MPTYNFECDNGHGKEEFFQLPSSCPKSIECDECDKPAKKVFSVGMPPYFRMGAGVKYEDGSGI